MLEKKRITRLALILCLIVFGFEAHSQRNCGTDSIHAVHMGFAEYENDYRAKLESIEELSQNRGDCAAPLLIPVAIHYQGVGFDLACATDMAIDQIETLNEDFGGYNADIATWEALKPTIWPSINNQESCICFCIATLNHPAGFGLAEGDYAITMDQTTGDFDAAWAGYLNIWVRDIGGGVLGYSPLGGTGNGDGVTCSPAYFGSVSCGGNTVNAPYNMGRTLTHEVGHYLFLEHPWAAGGCGSDDFVADTPVTDAPTFGCPTGELITCTDPLLWPSYMDYCDDACLFMFSAGQVDRMETYVEANLTNLTGNNATVCQEAVCLGFDMDVTTIDESCQGNDGVIQISLDEGLAPFQYSINGGASFTGTSDYLDLNQGDYSIVVTDDNGCELTQEVTLIRDDANLELVNVNHEYCSDGGGLIEIAVEGGGVFEYALEGSVDWQDSPIFTGLDAEIYNVQVQNATGCSGDMLVQVLNESDLNVTVESLEPVNCSWFDNGSIDLAIIGGTEPYTYVLDGSVDSPNGNFEDLSSGGHSIFMTDADGCVFTYDFVMPRSFAEIDKDCPCTVFIPSAITPNGNGNNEVLEVFPNCPLIDFHLQIFNRWGDQVFESFDQQDYWNGGLNGYYVDIDVYSYVFTWRWGSDEGAGAEIQTQYGHITVIR